MTCVRTLELSPTEHRAPARLRWLLPALLLIALLAVAAPLLLVATAPRQGSRVSQLVPRRVIPAAELPPVEPMTYVALAPDDARSYNAAIPFVEGSKPAARPFRYDGADLDRARATDCLAAALVYEAGDDATGQKAVAQVILNRLRHPAFPKTVCGVVFEGSQRATGCQFTFTCDGALARYRPSAPAWARAQAAAAQALNGAVYRPVGLATHYHTDWVVPYWQSSLDKLAKVGTHLFFRWTGWWGTPAAFGRRQAGPEPFEAKLAPLTGDAPTAADLAATPVTTAAGTEPFKPVDGDSFVVTLPAGVAPELWPGLAARACGDRPFCRFVAWKDKAKTPATLPLSTDQIASMSFSYLRDRPAGLERTLWNCRETPRSSLRECMKQQLLLVPAPLATPAPLASPAPLRGPAELEGVRRGRPLTMPGTAPAPAPSATPPRPRSAGATTPSPAAAAPQRIAP